MFDQPNPLAPSQPENKKSIEDIFDMVDDSQPTARPAASMPPRPQPKPASGPLPELVIPPGGVSANMSAGPSPFQPDRPQGGPSLIKNKKFFVIGLVALVVIVLGAGGWFAYAKFFSNSSAVKVNNNPAGNTNLNANTNLNTNTNLNANSNVNANANLNTNVEEPTVPVDTDDDGLSDEEESKLGTDPTSSDTDNDGLFDREELETYKTDPLNADTDGDGYLDGEEVKSGYDPRGAGKLFGIEDVNNQ
ncbi:MAG: hypothetical protein V1692_02130 [bacterium]